MKKVYKFGIISIKMSLSGKDICILNIEEEKILKSCIY